MSRQKVDIPLCIQFLVILPDVSIFNLAFYYEYFTNLEKRIFQQKRYIFAINGIFLDSNVHTISISYLNIVYI